MNDDSQEVMLLRLLSAALEHHGVDCAIPDMPRRAENERTASEAHIENRIQRLRQTDDLLVGGTNGPLPRVWLGFSLGAHCLLRIASRHPLPSYDPAVVILVGCVIEHPIHILVGTRKFKFIYGEDDHIAYEDAAGTMGSAFRPSQYGPSSAAKLILRRSQARSLESWSGCGHLLIPPAAEALPAVAKALADVVNTSLTGN
jgi:hypothetical protein